MALPNSPYEPVSPAISQRRVAFVDNREHLAAELAWLCSLLADYIATLRGQFELTQEMFLGLHVPDDLVQATIGAAPSTPRRDPFALRADLDARIQSSRQAGIRLPLAVAIERLGLDPFEAAALVVALAPELDLRYQALYAYAQNDAARRHPSLELVLSLLAPDAEQRFHWHGRFMSSRLLREQWIVLEPSNERPGRSLLGSEAAACRELIDFVLDRPPLSISAPLAAELDPAAVPISVHEQVRGAARTVGAQGVVVLRGRNGTGRRALARIAARAIDRESLVLDASAIDATELSARLGALGRAALLGNACPVLWQFDGALSGPSRAPVLRALASLRELRVGPTFIALETEQLADALAVKVPMPGLEERRALWRAAMPDGVEESVLNEVSTHFHLTPLQIARAAQKLDGTGRQSVFSAARSECIHHLEELATRVDVRPKLSDVVLPPHVEDTVHELLAAARHRYCVLHDWGFRERVPYGIGTYALFSGPSGTGKTFAAAAIAAELGLDLYRVDLSAVVSKYIGETEKNLDRVFREAEAASAMLVCDEADAFFGSRTQISDARDRYANMEVSYLLQRMEAHEGIVVLTTNLRKNIDEAFVRRIGHIIEFPFPEASLRERLFRSLLPSQAPIDPQIDFRAFARKFELSGGNIRNVLLAAASMAAEDGGLISTRHVLRATSRELQKLGKLSQKAMLREEDLR